MIRLRLEEEQKVEKDQRIAAFREQLQRVHDSLERQQQVNFNYDTIYNQLPSLQNQYLESTFFPS